jgi:hypothetical protein
MESVTLAYPFASVRALAGLRFPDPPTNEKLTCTLLLGLPLLSTRAVTGKLTVDLAKRKHKNW